MSTEHLALTDHCTIARFRSGKETGKAIENLFRQYIKLKHKRRFVRFLTGGNVKVLSELYLLAISQNILKAITKCNAGKLDFHLYMPETVA